MSEVGRRPIKVAVWNILYDKSHGDAVVPQFNRLGNIIDTLGMLGDSVDVTALLEVEKSDKGHHGEIIAKKLGYAFSEWQQHSRKNEYIGVLGSNISETDFIDIGHKKKAVTTRIGDVAVSALHLKRPHTLDHLREQMEQMDRFLSWIDGESRSVVKADFNGLPWQKPRRMLEAAGYKSVFSLLETPYPATVPTSAYRHLLTPRERLAVKMAGRLLRVDGIYIKGDLEVLDAGVLEGDSDHRLVHATLL